MTRLAIFDCDGTLVDSGGNIYSALSLALSGHGLDVPPPRECRRVIGLSLVEAIGLMMTGTPLEQIQIEGVASHD